MTTPHAGLYAFLTGDAAIGALIGTRMYPGNWPQKPTFPAIRYFVAGGERPHSTQGALGHAKPRFQIDCAGKDALKAWELADLVRKKIDGYRGPMGDIEVQGVFMETERELFEPEPSPGYNVVSRDYFIWYREDTGRD